MTSRSRRRSCPSPTASAMRSRFPCRSARAPSCCRIGRRRRRYWRRFGVIARPFSTPCRRSTRPCWRSPTSAPARAPTGKPVPGYEVKIVDENGRELPDGEIGELLVRGPSAGESYWNQRAKSRRTFVGEWTHTGDKYMRDADGYYYYCGRTDDMFKVHGMWVSPFEVEAALVSHEAVLEAAVIGKEDGDGLIKPKAFIVLKNGYGADERLFEALRTHVKERAGAWKYPRWI